MKNGLEFIVDALLDVFPEMLRLHLPTNSLILFTFLSCQIITQLGVLLLLHSHSVRPGIIHLPFVLEHSFAGYLMRQDATEFEPSCAPLSALHHPELLAGNKFRHIENVFSFELFDGLLALPIVDCVQPEFVTGTFFFSPIPLLTTAVFFDIIEGLVSSLEVLSDQRPEEAGLVSPVIHHGLVPCVFLLGELGQFFLGFLLFLGQAMVLYIEEFVFVHEHANSLVFPYSVFTVFAATAFLAGHQFHRAVSKFRNVEVSFLVEFLKAFLLDLALPLFHHHLILH